MEDHAIGEVKISVDIIGHDAATYTLVLQLPNGTIVPATVMKSNFSKHILPLLKNPPKVVAPEQPKPLPEEQKIQQDAQIQEAIQEQINAPTDEKPFNFDLWWDIEAMFQEIRWHAKNNDRKIVIEERDITPPRLALKCMKTDKSWSVDLKFLNDYCEKLFTSEDPASQAKGFQLRKCISTIEGRERLVASLNNAII